MKNSEHFFSTMQRLNPEIEDFEDAVTFAMSQVVKINSDTWFGEIIDTDSIDGRPCGVYYADSHESRWYPGENEHNVAFMIAREML